VYDPLVGRDAQGRFVPSLATRWSISDDLTTYTLTLRTGVVFQDGTPFDSAAVVAHFDRLQDPATQCSCVNQLATLASVDAPDPSTVVFELSAPSPFFLTTLAGPLGFVASPRATATRGTDYRTHPVGTGPFAVQTFDPLVLMKNPEYWRHDAEGRPLPYLDEVRFRPILDERDRLRAVRSGEVDLIQTPDDPTIVAAEHAGLEVQRATGPSSRILVLNTRRPPFDDVRVRRAVAYAIDRAEINASVYDGTRRTADAPLADGSQFDVDIALPGFDVDRARDILARADGSAAREPIRSTCIDTDEQHRLTTELTRQLQAVGLTIKGEFHDAGVFVNQVLGNREFDMACFVGPEVIDADGLYLSFHTGGAANVSQYRNPEVDAALEAIRRTADENEQRRLLRVVMKRIAADVPVIPLTYELSANIHRADVSGLPEPELATLGAIRLTTLYRR
jgi:ABC-type transport system substrate-binding protein